MSNLLKKIPLYYHTIKYLKLKQIFFQIYYKITPLKLHNKLSNKLLQQHTPLFKSISWAAPRFKQSPLSNDLEITFFNQRGNILDPKIWNSTEYSKLWLYQLHYFDALNSIDAEKHATTFHHYLSEWIQNNPLETKYSGNGWEPYTLSLRIINWIQWLTRYPEHIKPIYLNSLHQQATCLSRRLEYHILANHLFANAKALIFAGSFLKGEYAKKWLKKGLKILDIEIQEQFLADGGHFELSPMYHAIMLWDVCDLIHLAQCTQNNALLKRKNQWEQIVLRGLNWLQTMSHPDGEISFFNDAALDLAPSYVQINHYAKSIGIHHSNIIPKPLDLQYLKNSGYCAIPINENSKIILDTAPIGASYQPGHAHADTLSFELSLLGERIMVNSGVSQYGEDALRYAQRSTKAHNTIMIDEKNSSEIWAGFRVAKRAKPCHYHTKKDQNSLTIHCAHNGYQRLPGKNLHHRTWTVETNRLNITDEITGPFQSAIARFYFHPKIKLELTHPSEVTCVSPSNMKIKLSFEHAKSITIEQTQWYPKFGHQEPNQCIAVSLNCMPLKTIIAWGI